MQFRLTAVVLIGFAAPIAFGETLTPVDVPVPVDVMASAVDFVATDEGLFILSMSPGETGHDQSLYFVRFSDHERPQRIASRPKFLAKSLAGEALLVGNDDVETYSSSGVFLRSRPTTILSGLAQLADGSYIGHANSSAGRQPVLRKPMTESDFRTQLSEFGDDVAKLFRSLGSDGDELKSFDIFHIGIDFAIVSGILTIPRSSWTGKESEVPDSILFSEILERRHVRASPDGLHAVAFKLHQPEIMVLERRRGAWTSRPLPAVTEGMPTPKGAAQNLGLQYPTDRRLFYQSDVVVRASSLLVADPGTRAILSVSFDGVVLDRYDVDALVAEMELSGNALYVRTRDGKMIRYELPPGAD